MRILFLFLLCCIVLTGECWAKRLPRNCAILDYQNQREGFATKPLLPADTVGAREQIVVWKIAGDDDLKITPYFWFGDELPVFVDSLAVVDRALDLFLKGRITPRYDSVNLRTVYSDARVISVVHIDTIKGETKIRLENSNLTPRAFELDSVDKPCFGYLRINWVPVLVKGNAVDLYFEKKRQIRLNNPYPLRSVFVISLARTTEQLEYRYEEGKIE